MEVDTIFNAIRFYIYSNIERSTIELKPPVHDTRYFVLAVSHQREKKQDPIMNKVCLAQANKIM